MRLLLVEDSPRLQRSLGLGLRRAGFVVDIAGDGETGLFQALQNPYNVIILDIMLPKLDGLSVLRKLRENKVETHVLLLTARGGVDDRVEGLEAGGDDYLPKPFAFAELLARVRALCRRDHTRKSPRLQFGDFELDVAAKKLFREGKEIQLAPKEFRLLHLLATRPGEVFTRTDIEARIYDDRAEPLSNVVDSAICNLRKKLDPSGRRSIIQTRRGMGYVLEVAE